MKFKQMASILQRFVTKIKQERRNEDNNRIA
jgi:hypothetical protein